MVTTLTRFCTRLCGLRQDVTSLRYWASTNHFANRDRPRSDVAVDINMARVALGYVPQVSFQDGDAIAVPTPDPLKVLRKLRRTLPELQEVAALAPEQAVKWRQWAAMAYARSPGAKIYQGIEQEAFLMLDDAEHLVETKLVIQHIMPDNLHSAIDHSSNSVPIE